MKYETYENGRDIYAITPSGVEQGEKFCFTNK